MNAYLQDYLVVFGFLSLVALIVGAIFWIDPDGEFPPYDKGHP